MEIKVGDVISLKDYSETSTHGIVNKVGSMFIHATDEHGELFVIVKTEIKELCKSVELSNDDENLQGLLMMLDDVALKVFGPNPPPHIPDDSEFC
jgi:hypothetical protein